MANKQHAELTKSLTVTDSEKAMKIQAVLDKELKKPVKSECKAKNIGIELPEEIKAIKTKKKLAIVGFAPSWYQAPYADESFNVWGINEFYKMEHEAASKYKIKLRFDTWFEIHDIGNSPSKQSPEHQNFLRNLKMPLITQKHSDTYPTSMAYPRDAIKSEVNSGFIINDIGSVFTDYSNQITWMLALGIYLGYEEIHIYGVDMAANTEYNFQRASCQYFIGLATGKGIKVLIPKESELCKHYCDYGFESDNANRNLTKRRIKDLIQITSDMEAKIESIRFDMDRIIEEERQLTTVIEEDIKTLKADREKYKALIESQTLAFDFLKHSPNNLKEYMDKRKQVLATVSDTIQKDRTSIETIEKMLVQKVKERDDKRRHAYVNIKMLEKEEKHLKTQIASYSGAIGESKHLLANNIV